MGDIRLDEKKSGFPHLFFIMSFGIDRIDIGVRL